MELCAGGRLYFRAAIVLSELGPKMFDASGHRIRCRDLFFYKPLIPLGSGKVYLFKIFGNSTFMAIAR